MGKLRDEIYEMALDYLIDGDSREVIRLVADWVGGNLPDDWKSGEGEEEN